MSFRGTKKDIRKKVLHVNTYNNIESRCEILEGVNLLENDSCGTKSGMVRELLIDMWHNRKKLFYRVEQGCRKNFFALHIPRNKADIKE